MLPLLCRRPFAAAPLPSLLCCRSFAAAPLPPPLCRRSFAAAPLPPPLRRRFLIFSPRRLTRGADSQIFQRALPSAPPDRQAEEAAAASAAQSKAVRAPPLGFSENAAPFAGASLNGLRGSQNVYHDGAFGRKGLREHVVQFRNVLNAEALSAAKP